MYANRGDLLLAETAKRSPQAYTQVAAQPVLSRTDAWPHVALSNGRLICRDRDGSVRCVAVSSELASKEKPISATTPSRPTTTLAPSVSVKPVAAVTLKGDWPGTREGLAFAWDRSFEQGRVLSGFPDLPSISLKEREKASFAREGALAFEGGAFLLTGFEKTLTAGCQLSNQISIETVLTSSLPKQTGPARIVTFSSDGYSRNFTIGQESDQLILRLRTPQTGANGMNPEMKLGPLPAAQRTHLVVSYQPGQLDCWINGKRTLSTNQVQGDFSNWDSQHHLLLGDEWDGGSVRKWRGQIDRLSIYTRATTDSEVQQRFKLAGIPN